MAITVVEYFCVSLVIKRPFSINKKKTEFGWVPVYII